RVVALHLAPDLLVSQRLAATAVGRVDGESAEARVRGGPEKLLLLRQRRVLSGAVLFHEVDALLAELGCLLGREAGCGRGIGHVCCLRGLFRGFRRRCHPLCWRSAVAILYGIVQYESRPTPMTSANLTPHELDSPPWLRVEST